MLLPRPLPVLQPGSWLSAPQLPAVPAQPAAVPVRMQALKFGLHCQELMEQLCMIASTCNSGKVLQLYKVVVGTAWPFPRA